ncbi:hypoxanthine phosphoribosyltransferase [candidate division KD3-62 bacterium DG_56]|uniref:Hypoxanthine phosphoribosyltransferase n=1 Tax=candidate division KD3-62 bacterium DG_56 TaxID=1704032 RepID=A0A0S7XK65_9BACT|nr:MAG: hypoxanthine phosphoribosyltransferase [candidate division KD3-62 bacterium DG_56]
MSAEQDISRDIDRVLIDEQQIAAKVAEMAETISRDYAGKNPVLVAVLNGAVVFLSDLIRRLRIPVTIDFVKWSSYGDATRSSGVVRILKDLDESIEGRHVLIVEDIIDTGLTLHYLLENLRSRAPASVKVIALLDKPSRRRVEVRADYQGFDVPDAFVVGYGLDYAGRYRHLPYIGVLKPDVYAGSGTPPGEV